MIVSSLARSFPVGCCSSRSVARLSGPSSIVRLAFYTRCSGQKTIQTQKRTMLESQGDLDLNQSSRFGLTSCRDMLRPSGRVLACSNRASGSHISSVRCISKEHSSRQNTRGRSRGQTSPGHVIGVLFSFSDMGRP